MRQPRQRVADQNRLLNQMVNRTQMQIWRSPIIFSFNRITFEYDSEIEYCANAKLLIGNKDSGCRYCYALKFN